MPFYEYQCQRCAHHLESMQKVSDPPLKKCPKCGKPSLTRLMSAPVFRLKGGGWYETDFKSDGEDKRNLADRPEADAAKDDKKDDKKDDTKEPAATDAKPGDGAAKDATPAKQDKKPAAAKSTEAKPASRLSRRSSRAVAVATKPRKPAKKAPARPK